MNPSLKVLSIDPSTGFYRVQRYPLGESFGPVDLGVHISSRHPSINFGVGLFAGSIFPGSNRLVVSGFSPCWRSFFVSSMGGAGLVFDDLGINLVSLVGKAPVPSVLILNRCHGEEIEVEIAPIDLGRTWSSGRGGVYSVLDEVHARYRNRFQTDRASWPWAPPQPRPISAPSCRRPSSTVR